MRAQQVARTARVCARAFLSRARALDGVLSAHVRVCFLYNIVDMIVESIFVQGINTMGITMGITRVLGSIGRLVFVLRIRDNKFRIFYSTPTLF